MLPYTCDRRHPKQPVELETHIPDLLAVCKLAKAREVSVDDVRC